MNNDLISRSALLGILMFWSKTLRRERGGCEDEFLQAVINIVDAQRVVDAEPVRHGRWLPPVVGKSGCTCSQCFSQVDNDFNYCPNCGAKMDGGNTR